MQNRLGGSAAIASGAVATSAPDGHTLLLALSAYAVNLISLKQLPYDTFRDFAALRMLARLALVVGANAAVKGTNLRKFIEANSARRNESVGAAVHCDCDGIRGGGEGVRHYSGLTFQLS